MLRRWRAAWPRRGQVWQVPPVSAAPAAPEWPPTYQAQERRQALLSRRGRFLAVPSAPAAPAAPEAALGPLRARSRWLPRLRRGRFFPTTPRGELAVIYGPGAASGVGVTAGRRFFLARRGSFAEPPWVQIVAQPSLWRPQPVRATLRLAGRPVRRGAFTEPPWPQGPQTVWRPGFTRAIGRPGRPVRRGSFAEPPWVQVQAEPLVWRPGHRRATARLAGRPTRRGQFHEPPWVVPPFWAPRFLRHRPRPVPTLARRGQYHEPRWVEGPQTVWRPDPVCQTGNRPKWPTHRLRRGRRFEPVWPQVVITTPPPRWMEGTAAAVGLDGAAGAAGLEGAAAGAGLEGTGGHGV